MAPCRETWLCLALLAAIIGTAVPERAFADSYVRGSVLFDRPKDTGFLDDDCSTAEDRYACETGIDGDFDTMTGLEVGLGYAMMPALRLEAALQYRPEFSFKGQADISLQDTFLPLNLTAERDFTAELTVWSAMLSAYLDIPIPGLGLLRHTPLSPFVGIGGGVSRLEIGDADFGGSQSQAQASRLILPETTNSASRGCCPQGSRYPWQIGRWMWRGDTRISAVSNPPPASPRTYVVSRAATCQTLTAAGLHPWRTTQPRIDAVFAVCVLVS